MKILPKSLDKDFEGLLYADHDTVRKVYSNFITDEDVLSCNIHTDVVFLSKSEIQKLWNSFWKQFSDKYDTNYTIDYIDWENVYSEHFHNFLLAQLNLTNDALWFSHLMDYAYELYCAKEQWRLPTVAELSAMFNKETGKFINGFDSFAYYWTSTTDANNTNNAWYVKFDYGCTDTYYRVNDLCVRCVREVEKGVLELAPTSTTLMSYNKAITYAKTLQVPEEDIIKVKLNGWYYEEIKPLKKYKVIIELNVTETDLADIIVEATSEEEAKELAIKAYNDDDVTIDYYASSNIKTTSSNNSTNWTVECLN